MKIDVRLNSVIPHGVGSSSECGAIELIYMYLLKEFEQNAYSRISINQVGNDLNEFVLKEPGNRIHVNIRYPIYADFETKSTEERNKIRLNVIHTALLRIAEYDNKIAINVLEEIKEKILMNNFSFHFDYKTYANKINKFLIAKVIIEPIIDRFNFYIVIDEDNKLKCKHLIFEGKPNIFYIEKYFCYGKWNHQRKFIVWGKEKTVETHIDMDTCTVDVLNLTAYSDPPYYTLMKVGIGEEKREKARKDWHHSLPPHIAASIREADN